MGYVMSQRHATECVLASMQMTTFPENYHIEFLLNWIIKNIKNLRPVTDYSFDPKNVRQFNLTMLHSPSLNSSLTEAASDKNYQIQ